MVRAWILCVTLGFALVVGAAARACDRGTFGIAVDPGHTRARPGTTSARGVPELRFNENLARFLHDELIRMGFRNTFFTHENAPNIALADRANLANRHNARLFLSIHHDSVQPRYLSTWRHGDKRRAYSDVFSGYSLFFSEKNGDPRGSMAFARLLGAELRNRCFVPTRHHAEKIGGEHRELVDEARGIYRFDDLIVLKSTRMPAVLIEAGLIVNRADEILLRDPVYQNALVRSITGAVADFCEGKAPDAAIAPSCPRNSSAEGSEAVVGTGGPAPTN